MAGREYLAIGRILQHPLDGGLRWRLPVPGHDLRRHVAERDAHDPVTGDRRGLLEHDAALGRPELRRLHLRPLELRRGQLLSEDDLIARLNDLGYAQRPQADGPGEFAIVRNTITIRARSGPAAASSSSSNAATEGPSSRWSAMIARNRVISRSRAARYSPHASGGDAASQRVANVEGFVRLLEITLDLRATLRSPDEIVLTRAK